MIWVCSGILYIGVSSRCLHYSHNYQLMFGTHGLAASMVSPGGAHHAIRVARDGSDGTVPSKPTASVSPRCTTPALQATNKYKELAPHEMSGSMESRKPHGDAEHCADVHAGSQAAADAHQPCCQHRKVGRRGGGGLGQRQVVADGQRPRSGGGAYT